MGFNTQGWSSAPSLPPAFYRNLISSSVLINSAPDFTLPSCTVTPRADFMSAGRGQEEDIQTHHILHLFLVSLTCLRPSSRILCRIQI